MPPSQPVESLSPDDGMNGFEYWVDKAAQKLLLVALISILLGNTVVLMAYVSGIR